MQLIEISEKIKNYNFEVVLGCLVCEVKVTESISEFDNVIYQAEKQLKLMYSNEDIAKIYPIQMAKKFYKTIGKDPSRYRLSSEALIKRIIKNKSLYRINNIVDINNLISMKYYYSVGSYDLDKIDSQIIFSIGKPGDKYIGIGKKQINLEKLPIFIDLKGPFGSPTSDSEKAMITLQTKKLLMLIISFSGIKDLDVQINESKLLLEKYADAKNVKTFIKT